MNENVGIIQVGNIYPDTPTFQNRTMGRVYSPEGICPTLNTTGGGDRVPLIVEMNENLGITKINMPDGLVGINGKKPIRPEDILPYLPSEDCVFDSRHWVAGSVEGGVFPFAVTTRISANCQQYLKVKEKCTSNKQPKQDTSMSKKVECLTPPSPNSSTRRGRVQGEDGDIAPTLTRKSIEYITLNEDEARDRLRKLTERECFRLMGVTDHNIDLIQQAGISSTAQYRLAGNSIVVPQLAGILRNLLFGTEKPEGYLF